MYELSTWSDHARRYLNVDTVNAGLAAAVPAYEHLGCRMTRIEDGFCEGVLPLGVASTNQHLTHQAALIAFIGDYVGGTALCTVFHGFPVLGVHPVRHRNPVALWAASINIRFKAPSTDDLVVSCLVPEERRAALRTRFVAGERIVEPLTIQFRSGDVLVAEAEYAYFAQQRHRLKPREAGKANVLFNLSLKTAALLIAAIRAGGSGGDGASDLLSARVAGARGRVLAERFLASSPQLREMVLARTRHIDELAARMTSGGLQQLVLVGAGFDLRNERPPLAGVQTFAADLPYMLAERRRVRASLGLTSPEHEVPVDLEEQSLLEVLRAQPAFRADRPTLFVVEGLSMYLDDATNARMLRDLRDACGSPESAVWMDAVDRRLLERPASRLEVERFLSNMEALGEPFVFGVDDFASCAAVWGFQRCESVASDLYLGAGADPVYDHYRFLVLRC